MFLACTFISLQLYEKIINSKVFLKGIAGFLGAHIVKVNCFLMKALLSSIKEAIIYKA